MFDSVDVDNSCRLHMAVAPDTQNVKAWAKVKGKKLKL